MRCASGPRFGRLFLDLEPFLGLGSRETKRKTIIILGRLAFPEKSGPSLGQPEEACLHANMLGTGSGNFNPVLYAPNENWQSALCCPQSEQGPQERHTQMGMGMTFCWSWYAFGWETERTPICLEGSLIMWAGGREGLIWAYLGTSPPKPPSPCTETKPYGCGL